MRIQLSNLIKFKNGIQVFLAILFIYFKVYINFFIEPANQISTEIEHFLIVKYFNIDFIYWSKIVSNALP